MGNQAKPPRSFNTIRNSQTKIRAKRRRQSRVVLLLMALVASLLVLTLIVFGVWSLVDVISKNVGGIPDTGNGGDTPPAPPQSVLYDDQITRIATDVYWGELILVNQDHHYQFPTNLALTDIAENRSQINGANIYQINSAAKYMEENAFTAFEALMKKHYEVSEGDASVLVNDAYRTAKEQEGKAVPVGASDHHTGYCIALKDAETREWLKGGTHWAIQNAYKYGFIMRYPEAKSDITGINDYESCLRYVGVAHSTYITEHGLCMEEYIELLQQNYKDGNRLAIQGADGNSYEVYYVSLSGDEVTTITVPSNYEYTVSGDNIGGFIVTVNLSAPKE